MSTKAVGVLGSCVATLLLSAASALAQEEAATGPGHRQGFWVTVGGGYAVARGSCSQCGEDPPYRDRPGFYVEMGGVVSRHVLAAGEVFTQSDDVGGSSVRVTHFTGTLHWYPGSAPVYIKFGFGLSRGRNTFVVEGEETRELATGTGIMFGFGADVRLSRRFSLSPVASWYMGAVGDFQTAAGLARSVSANTWFAGVGLTFN